MYEEDKRKVQEIYKITLDKLKELFKLETCEVSKLIDGFGPNQDTIIYTKKQMDNHPSIFLNNKLSIS